MNRRYTFFTHLVVAAITLVLLMPVFSLGAENQDMRAVQMEANKSIQALKAKADAEKAAAEQEAAESRAKITKDRTALTAEVVRLEAQAKELENAVINLDDQDKKLVEQETALNVKLSEADGVVKELVGVVRIHAKDLQSLIDNSLQTALGGADTGFLEEIAAAKRFPSLDDITAMNELAYSQLAAGGAVRMIKGSITNRAGENAAADILVLGNFTAAYRLGDEVGFLNHSSAGQKLFALSRLPSRSQRHQLLEYMEGKSEAVPIDISRGGALDQLTRTPTLTEQIESGGPLVWPILLILVVAILISIERLIYLWRSRVSSDVFSERLESLCEKGDWQSCAAECQRMNGKPLSRVLATGCAFVGMERETMENGLQEAILKEIPTMERFLSTLGMLAAIAPLLGLLGTVTGMIDTFQVITQFGTGDPRLMSSGISVALVTTMLGLSVAIPIMLVHSLLNRSVDNRIAEMEEKAVALVNYAERYRNGLA